MRRILQIITKSELGGAQSHVADLLDGLRNADTELHIATGIEGALTERARELGAHVHILPRLQRSLNPVKDRAAVRECAQLLRRVRPHIVHAHSSKAGVIARLAGRRTGIPVIFTVHGWGFNPGTSLPSRVIAWAVEFSLAFVGARIICVSENSRQSALSLRVGNKERLVTIHNGILPDAPLAHPEAVPARIVMVARFSEPKDHATLLRAVAALSTQDTPDFTLNLVGTGPNFEAMQLLARELQIENRVKFLGDRHDVADILGESQIFVLSTYSEGLPISIMEAMRAGLPVIATDVGGISEEVEHRHNGFLVPAHDAPALAEALRELLRSPDLRAQMGHASRQKFEGAFTRDRMINQIQQLYAQVQRRR